MVIQEKSTVYYWVFYPHETYINFQFWIYSQDDQNISDAAPKPQSLPSNVAQAPKAMVQKPQGMQQNMPQQPQPLFNQGDI